MMWPGKGTAGIVQEAGVLHRSGTDDDVADAIVEATLDGVEIADPAAQLDRYLVSDGIEDGLDGGLVLRLAGESAVEVHRCRRRAPLVDQWRAMALAASEKDGGLFHQALF